MDNDQGVDLTTPEANAAPNTSYNEAPQKASMDTVINPDYNKLYQPYDLSKTENDDAFNRPQLVSRFNWNYTDGYAAGLYSDSLYAQLFHLTTSSVAVNNPMARLTSAYLGWKGDIEVTLWTAGNHNCTGALIAATRFDQNTNGTNPINMCADPNNAILTCQSQDKLRIVIPYKSARWNYRDPAKMFNAWGTFVIQVLIPMVNASSVTPPPLQVCVSARFVNVKLFGPTTKAFQSLDPQKEYQSSFKKEAQAVAKTGLNYVKDVIPGSRLAVNVAKGIGRLFNPKLVDTLEEWGFDYPIDQSKVQRTRDEPLPVLTQKAGVLEALTLGSDPYEPTVQIDDPMGCDFSSFKNYGSLFSLQKIFEMTTDTVTDTAQTKIPICPQYVPASPLVPGTSSFIQPGPVQWMSNKFMRWRGGLVYKIMFFCPVGVTATARITHQPEGIADSVTTQDSIDAGDVVSEVVYIDKDQVNLVHIPYNGLTPTKICPGNPTQLSQYDLDSTMGTLSISLVTKITNAFNVAAKIQVAVFVACAQDMQFFGLKDDTNKTYQSELSPAEPPSGYEKHMDARPMIKAESASAPGFTCQEEFKSWKELCTMMRVKTNAYPLTFTVTSEFPLIIPWTFVSMRGNARIGLSLASTTTTVIKQLQNRSATPTVKGASFTCYRNQDQNVRLFELPYNANVPWMEIAPATSILRANTYEDAVVFSAGGTLQLYGHSDDLQLFFPAFPPLIVMNDNAYT